MWLPILSLIISTDLTPHVYYTSKGCYGLFWESFPKPFKQKTIGFCRLVNNKEDYLGLLQLSSSENFHTKDPPYGS